MRIDSPINPDEEKKSPTETGRALLGFDEVQAVTFEEEEPMDMLSPMSDGIIKIGSTVGSATPAWVRLYSLAPFILLRKRGDC